MNILSPLLAGFLSLPGLRPATARLRGRSRALAEKAGPLRHALPLLPQATQKLEQQYLELQGRFENLAEIAGELVARGRQVVAMACGKDTGTADFERTLAVLSAPMEYLNLALADLPEIGSSLERACSETARLLELEQALEQTLAPLRFTRVLFQVESAGLAQAERESFGALTQQIAELHGRVQISLEQHFHALLETREGLQSAVDTLERYRTENAGQLDRRRTEMSLSLEILRQQLEENARRDVKLTSASESLAAEVNRAVTAMQTQDIVAQKLNHASHGLREAVAALGQMHTDPRRLGPLPTVVRIELAQLESVESELTRSQALLVEAVSGIENQLSQMDDQCLMLREFRNITASVDGAAQVLIDSLGALREATADMLRMTVRLEEILRPVESAAAIITGTVSAVAAEIHRIALNAQIHAVQTGGRTGLEVLAEHMGGLARETLRINAELSAGLAETAGIVRTSGARLGALRRHGERAREACQRDGAREEASLHEFRDRVLDAVHGVSALLARARQISSEMLSAMDFSSARTLIGEVRRRVAELAGEAEPFSSPGGAGAAIGLERRYTMASERHVHRSVLAGLHPDRAPQPGAETQLGGTVELF